MNTTSSLIPTSALPPYEFKKGRLYRSHEGTVVLATAEGTSSGTFAGVLVYSAAEPSSIGFFSGHWDKTSFAPYFGSVEIRQEM